jgi:hypothetical protein
VAVSVQGKLNSLFEGDLSIMLRDIEASPFRPTLRTNNMKNTRCRKSRDSSIGVAALGHGLEDRNSRVRFPAGAGNFSLHHGVQNGSGTHLASYPVGTRGSFPGVKRPEHEADNFLPSNAEVKECVELYLHCPSTPSWRGA